MVRGHNHFSRHYRIDPALRFAAALIALIIKGLRNKMTGYHKQNPETDSMICAKISQGRAEVAELKT